MLHYQDLYAYHKFKLVMNGLMHEDTIFMRTFDFFVEEIFKSTC